MRNNFGSIKLPSFSNSEKEVRGLLKDILENLTVDQLNAMYTPKEVPAGAKDTTVQQLSPQEIIRQELAKPIVPQIAKQSDSIPTTPSMSAELEKSVAGPDTYKLKIDKPIKLIVVDKNVPATPIGEMYDISTSLHENEEGEVEEEVLAPLELAPKEYLDNKKVDSDVDTKDLSKDGIVAIIVAPEPVEEPVMKKGSYDAIPEMDPEELEALRKIASVLTPNGNAKIINANRFLSDGPIGTIKPTSRIMAPEDDPDGMSVVGLNNDVGMKFLMK